MNKEINYNYKLPPFKWFCLTNFPFIEADFDALTYYELLCKVVQYLNEVIVKTNAIGEQTEELTNAFNTLKEYVDTYFDNLDVQKEINNKLDEMAESGELEEIISQYLNSTAVFGFDNVASMKSATNLIDGSYAKTLGYYTKNDGGAGLYKIRTITNDDVVDGGSIIAMNDNTLIAELIIIDKINIIQFGAYGDGVHDDTTSLQNVIEYAENNHFSLISPSNKTYLISRALTFGTNPLSIDFNGSTIITNNAIDMLLFDEEVLSFVNHGFIKNLVIDMNNVANVGIHIFRYSKKLFTNITIKNISNIGYKCDNASAEMIFEKSHFYGTSSTATGLYIDASDSHYNDIIMIDVHTCIYNFGSNFYTRIHAWMKTGALMPGSKYMIHAGGQAFMNQCYSDTYQYSYYLTYTDPFTIKLNECFNYLNPGYLTTEVLETMNNEIYMFYATDPKALYYVTITQSWLQGLRTHEEYSYFTNSSTDNNGNHFIQIDAGTTLYNWKNSNKYQLFQLTSSDVIQDVNTDVTLSGTITSVNNNASIKATVINTNALTTGTIVLIGKLKKYALPIKEVMFPALVGSTTAYSNLSSKATCWINETGSIFISCNDDISANSRIYINNTYNTYTKD